MLCTGDAAVQERPCDNTSFLTQGAEYLLILLYAVLSKHQSYSMDKLKFCICEPPNIAELYCSSSTFPENHHSGTLFHKVPGL